jgi:hypothetical protein
MPEDGRNMQYTCQGTVRIKINLFFIRLNNCSFLSTKQSGVVYKKDTILDFGFVSFFWLVVWSVEISWKSGFLFTVDISDIQCAYQQFFFESDNGI